MKSNIREIFKKYKLSKSAGRMLRVYIADVKTPHSPR